MYRIFLSILALLLFSSFAISENWDVSGHIGVESRYFLDAPLYDNQIDVIQLSASGELNLNVKLRDNYFSFSTFTRVDSQDSERTHIDIREAYWKRSFDKIDVLAGINTEFWGVAESQHLINIINTSDQLENLDQENFLGQPMVKVTLNEDIGQFSLFVLPYFRPLRFSESKARLRTQLSVRNDNDLYLGNAKEDYISSALRYSHYWGDWDIGLHYFHGIERDNINLQPSDFHELPLPNGSTQRVPTKLSPLYEVIDQVGIDLQLTTDAWLIKLEALHRNPEISDTYFSMVSGFEYSLYQLLDTKKDLGLLAEYSYSERKNILLEDDIFLGLRLTWNDVNDASLLMGVIVDVNDNSTSLRLEAERRLGDSCKLDIEVQTFFNTAENNPLYQLRNDDFIALRITNYF